jgi:N-methylhydantoinase A
MRTGKGLGDLSFVDDTLGPKAIEAFNKRHMEEFGHVREGEMPEITGVRLVSYADTPSPRVTGGFGAPTVAAKPAKTRRANLGAGYKETAVFRGSALEPGHELEGPAIIEETFTTIVVYPGWKARVDDAGDYELTLSRRSADR